MLFAPQSSPGRGRLPASITLLLLGLAAASHAQDRIPITQPTEFRKAPASTVLGTLLPGARVERKRTQGRWDEVTVGGWIFSRSLEPARRDGYDLVVRATGGENLRESPDGRAVARLVLGTLLKKEEVKGGWTRVTRTAWIPAERQTAAPPVSDRTRPQEPVARAQPPAAPADVPAAATPERPAGAIVTASRNVPVLASPGGQQTGAMAGGATAAVIARSGDGWVKVRLEGWVRESEVQPGEAPAVPALTAAELRAAPDKYIGAPVEWRLQFISIQTADALRPEIPEGQPFVLARGPLPESGFVYVMVRREQLATFRSLAPLAEFTMRGTIRAPRTRYLPTPVVELTSVISR